MIPFLLWVRTVPSWVWVALACVALAGGLYLKGRSDGKEACQNAQEAAEKQADKRAATVAKAAQERARKATAAITERTEGAADEVQREMDAARVCPEPVQPERVSELGREAVERAQRALRSTEG